MRVRSERSKGKHDADLSLIRPLRRVIAVTLARAVGDLGLLFDIGFELGDVGRYSVALGLVGP